MNRRMVAPFVFATTRSQRQREETRATELLEMNGLPLKKTSVADLERHRDLVYLVGHPERKELNICGLSGQTIAGGALAAQKAVRCALHYRGANAIIALRCLQLSGRWEEFWEGRAAG